jgi:peptidoglycan/LPS O-acetylase OafA/YrhL
MAIDAASSANTRLAGLDGLRGFALLIVLGYHLWPDMVPGGLVGVSLFFTLSGFVIMRRLLIERAETGRTSLRGFWAQRLRRLWFASTITLAAVAVGWLVARALTPQIAADIAASFAQVANWRFIATGATYGASDASPVAHFWSLSIEEQFYLAVPLVVAAAAGSRRILAAVFSAVIVASVAYTLANAGDATVVYYSTFSRAAEIAAGALAAIIVAHINHHAVPRRPIRPGLGALGIAGLGALTWATLRTSLGTETYYAGGLTLLAVPSLAAIGAAVWHPATRKVLSWRPLVWLGGVSYAVYLIHWPLGVALASSPVTPWLRPWLTLAVSFPLAVLSLRYVEGPVRERRANRTVVMHAATALTAAIVAISALGMIREPPRGTIDFEAMEKKAYAVRDSATPSVDLRVDEADRATVGTPQRPLRVGLFGDSTALSLGVGMDASQLDARVAGAPVAAQLGCTIGPGGRLRGAPDIGDDPNVAPFLANGCDATRWAKEASAVARQRGPLDVAVVLGGNWDIIGRSVPKLGRKFWIIGEPEYDTWLRKEMANGFDALHDAGVPIVVWMTLPPDVGQERSERLDRLNTMAAEVAAERPWMRVIDYAGHLASLDEATQRELRPDGRHLAEDDRGAGWLASNWLNDQLIEAYRT